MAAIKIEVLSWMARAFGQQESGRVILDHPVEEGETVGQLFQRLTQEYDRFGELVYDAKSGRLRDQVNVVINDRMLALAKGLDTPLTDGDVLVLIPAYAGGGA